MGNLWTEYEIRLLKDNYKKSLPELCQLLNRSKVAIELKRSKLNLSRHRYSWTKEEDSFIINNYQKMTYNKISKSLNIPIRTVRTRIEVLRSQLKLPKRQFYYADDTYFSSIGIVQSYWAGFIAADGCISQERQRLSFELQLRDYTHLLKFMKCTNFDGKLILKERKNKGWSSQLHINKIKTWVLKLREIYNITPRKSLTLQPPKNLSLENSLAFIIGYIDGDGSICFKDLVKSKTISVSIYGTNELLTWIKEKFDNLITVESYRKYSCPHRNRTIWQYNLSGKRALKILNILNNIQVPKLERKWNKVKDFIN